MSAIHGTREDPDGLEPVGSISDGVATQPPDRNQAETVYAWRYEQFTRAGAPQAIAAHLADANGPDGWPVDTHRYATIVGNGCTPQLAAEILA